MDVGMNMDESVDLGQAFSSIGVGFRLNFFLMQRYLLPLRFDWAWPLSGLDPTFTFAFGEMF